MHECLSHLLFYNNILLFNICYKHYGCDDDDDICEIETQDDWVVIELGCDWVMRCEILKV
jgi:hypothetical protein